MLVPPPTPTGMARLRALLELHDGLEEGPTGVYADCDQILAGDSAAVIAQLRDYPPVRTAPHNDGPAVERHIVETLVLAGREKLQS
jgi:hypothetical protein